MIKKAFASAGIALALLIATPVAANAAYVPAEDTIVSDSTPAPGQTVTVTFEESFTPGETVRFTVTGEGAVTIAAITSDSVDKTADANGTVSARVTLPLDARGTYTVTATGLSSGIIGTAALTVVPADANGNGAGNGSNGTITLPVTGAEIPVATVWIAGGVLVLGAVLVSVVTVRRRNLDNN
jgi:plastocyanin